MATAKQISQYQKAQALVEKDLRKNLKALWAKVKDLDPIGARGILEQAVPQLVDKYGLMQGSLAADWFEQLTGERGYVPDSYRREAWEASTRWALGELFTGTEASQAKALAFDRLSSAVVRHVRQHGRDTIDESVRQSGGKVRYARRVVGKTCDFCLMVASRGPVYGTKTDAGGEGNRYHSDCDCIPVPVAGRWIVDDSPRGSHWEGQSPGYDFEKLYEQEYKPFWRENDTLKDVLERRREMAVKSSRRKRVIPQGSIGDYLRRLEESGDLRRKECKPLPHPLSGDDIVSRVGKRDTTNGSCGSVAYAYAGNRAGLDVHDFRGGTSQSFFSTWGNTGAISKIKGVVSWSEETRNEVTSTTKLISNMEKDKEYILGVTRHAAIIRKRKSGALQYLELQQDGEANGWKRLDVPTLLNRFRATTDAFADFGEDHSGRVDLISVESLKKNKEFLDLLPYINT